MSTRAFFRACGVATGCLVAATTGGTTGIESVETSTTPALLSGTGLYSDTTSLTVDPRHRPYSPQYPLWTDGAQKRRWVSLPPGTVIDVQEVDAWSFPVGTRFWKEFSFGGRRVETRMLVNTRAQGWQFASYVWNDAQTDAELAPAEGVPDLVEVAPGKRHSVPSLDDCRTCHDSNRTEVLGFTALQLSDDRDPLAPHAEPATPGMATLRSLLEARRLRPARSEFATSPPRIPAGSPRARATLGYLSTNCGACHNQSSTLASLGLVFRQPAYGGGLHVVSAGLARRTKWDRPGSIPDTTKVVDPDALDHSALLVRIRSRRGATQMPPLGSVMPDHDAVEMITRWVQEDLRPTAVLDDDRLAPPDATDKAPRESHYGESSALPSPTLLSR